MSEIVKTEQEVITRKTMTGKKKMSITTIFGKIRVPQLQIRIFDKVLRNYRQKSVGRLLLGISSYLIL
jgi:hypothetical protein